MHAEGAEQGAGRVEEGGGIVVPRHHNHMPARAAAPRRVVQEAVIECLGLIAGEPAVEYVARKEQGLDAFPVHEVSQPGQKGAEFILPFPAEKRVAQMPVGGVEYFHVSIRDVPSSAGYAAGGRGGVKGPSRRERGQKRSSSALPFCQASCLPLRTGRRPEGGAACPGMCCRRKRPPPAPRRKKALPCGRAVRKTLRYGEGTITCRPCWRKGRGR